MQVDGKNGIDLVVGAKNKGAEIGWFQAPRNARELSIWKWHTICRPIGIKYDKLELVDLDGDLDVLTCEENYVTDSKGLGVILV